MSTSPSTVPSLDITHPIERARPNAWRRRGLRNRRGAVVVEFALIATLLVSMIVGVVDFGRAVWVRVSVGHAAREGARWAIVRGSESGRVADTAAVGAYVRSKIPISPLAVTTTWTPNTDPGSVVRVQVQSVFTPVIFLIPTITLTATSEMVITF